MGRGSRLRELFGRPDAGVWPPEGPLPPKTPTPLSPSASSPVWIVVVVLIVVAVGLLAFVMFGGRR